MNPKSLLPLLAGALLATGCVFDGGTESGGGSGGPATSSKVFVLSQDYTTNSAALDVDSGDVKIRRQVQSWTSSDVVVQVDSAAGVLYAIQRTNNVVTGYKLPDLVQTTVDVNLGAGANPYSVAAVGGKLWVACYGSSFLKAVDLSTKRLVDSVDLSAYAYVSGSETNPNAFSVHAWDGKVAVVLGRLKDGWKPGDSSLVLVVDPANGSVAKRIALPWKNAYGAAWRGDSLLVACVGAWSSEDGGVALVDLRSGTATAVVSEATLGGDVSAVSFGPGNSAFAGMYKSITSVWAVDLAGRTLGGKVSGDANVLSFAWDGSELWMGTKAPSLVRATATGTVLSTTATTYAPGSLAIVR